MEDRTLRRVLRADAVWDAVLGAALCALASVQPWPLFVALGIGCFAFAVVLERGARGTESIPVCRAAAVGNALAVVAVIVVLALLPDPRAITVAALVVAAAGCAAFAALEWRAAF
jgi:hypothetical protein